MWVDLIMSKRSFGGGGVPYTQERKEHSLVDSHTKITEFQQFISEMNLIKYLC